MNLEGQHEKRGAECTLSISTFDSKATFISTHISSPSAQKRPTGAEIDRLIGLGLDLGKRAGGSGNSNRIYFVDMCAMMRRFTVGATQLRSIPDVTVRRSQYVLNANN